MMDIAALAVLLALEMGDCVDDDSVILEILQDSYTPENYNDQKEPSE